MALMGFGDINDMFGHVDRMMNNIMSNMINPMADPFGMMGSMMPGMPNMANFSSMAHHGGSYVSSSSVMITNDGSGRPQVYQATKTARYGPGGVAETQETIRDSASGLQKMAIGHHINDRGHVMEKSKNFYTGQEEEKDEFINLEEEEGQQFEEEWKSRMGAAYAQQRRYGDRALTSGQCSGPLAITAGPSTSSEPSSNLNYYPQHQSRHLHQTQHHHPHHQHHHHHHNQRISSHHHHQRGDNAQSFRCDPDIEIISPSNRSQDNQQQQQPGSSQQCSNRHRATSKQRSKKDKKPYKRSNKNADQQR